MRRTKRLLVLATIFFLTGCLGSDLAPNPALVDIQAPRPVIFDTDMAHEDMFAALFLLSHPNVDLRAITVASTGEAHCQPGVAHALGLVILSDHEPIPVACGPEAPLAGNHEFPGQWRQAADSAYGVSMPEGGKAHTLEAPDLIIDILENSEQKIDIIAVGPLTNIAEALERAPEIVDRIEAIFIMGGAVETQGNVGVSGVGIDNEFAEWNIFVDPLAANIVLSSGVPITLIPLDATEDVPISRGFYRALGGNRGTAAADLVYKLLTANLDFVDRGGFQFWDTLTAAVFTDESLATFEQMPLVVVEEQGLESGRTLRTEGGPPIRVATAAERERFEQLLLTILNWSH